MLDSSQKGTYNIHKGSQRGTQNTTISVTDRKTPKIG